MSERGHFRGGRGGGGRGHRGGDRGRGGNTQGAQATVEKKKENILDLSKYRDKEINVKFSGGREGISLRSPKFNNVPLIENSDWHT